MTGLALYTYFRSGASYRTRIALALKGLTYDSVPVHLLRDGGEQLKPAYRAVNPQGRVPALRLPGGELLVQSMAIMEYLEEVYPEPALLPKGPVERAHVRAVASMIACDIQPLGNLAVLQRLRAIGCDKETVSAWTSHWIGAGFTAVEALIGDEGWCFGAAPGMADACLIPQVYAARRNEVPLEAYPRILRVAGLAAEHPAFVAAEPGRQPDAE